MFPRKTNPIYPHNASDEEKKYITWQTAHVDIENLRRKGYKGVKFEVFPKLVNVNRGKYKTVQAVWNKWFNCYVRTSEKLIEKMEKSPSKLRKKEMKVPAAPEWEYRILKIQRL